MAAPVKTKKVLGRPKGSVKHPYRKAYDQMLMDHMATGLSFESFGGVVRAGKSVLYKWVDQNPTFLDAKLTGESLCRLFWEKMGIKGVFFKKDGWQINSNHYRLNMKNRFGWHDGQTIEDSVKKDEDKSKLQIIFGEAPTQVEGKK